MRLHEFEAKQRFAAAGITVPGGDVARSPEEAGRIARELGGDVMVKAQVLAGGRGKAGGVRRAKDQGEAEAAARDILAGEIRGQRPEGVLVESAVAAVAEVYVGITVDSANGRPAIVVSAKGGVDIEEAAALDPQAIASCHVDPIEGLQPGEAELVAQQAGLEGQTGEAVAETIARLYDVFSSTEAVIAEINPLMVSGDGTPMAVDAVLEVDDAALFRHEDLKAIADGRPQDPLSRAAKACGMTFVGLGGEIGLICSGAGLGMATMDLVSDSASAANFLETGGGITRELMAEAMRIVLSQPGLKGVLINIYGGINPIHEGAKGVADAIEEGERVPIVAKALGNYQEETWETLAAAGISVVKEVETERAVEEMLRRAVASSQSPPCLPKSNLRPVRG